MLSTTLVFILSQVVPPGLGTQPGDLDGGEPIADAIVRCGSCHDRSILNPGDPMYMPFDTWVSSMMANSVRDPLFRAALDVANQDVPGLGTWCLRCHAPQSYVRGHGVPADGGAFDEVDMQGVSCDVCHRSIAAPDSGSPVIGNAQIYFEYGNVKYGPYSEANSPAHGGSDGGITASSEMCGQCHQVSNPLVAWRNPFDGGTLGPNFPLDTTYDEWQQSQFVSGPTAKSCQDCHMPRITSTDGGSNEFFVAKFGVPRISPRRHTFVGSNIWGLEAVQKNDPGHTALLVEQFDESKRLAAESLRTAAELTVTLPETTMPGDTLFVRVRVKNNTGHKLPTGYADGRRMVIQMTLNGLVHTGRFDGGTLLDDPWLRVYEIAHGQYGVGVEEHLAKHDIIVRDTRLLPSGFRPPAGAATLPVPAALYRGDDGGYLDYDELAWDVEVPTTLVDGETFDVMVRLLFQVTTPGYVEFLRKENRTTDAGQNLHDIWKATNEAAPFEMARVEKKIRVRARDGGTGGGAGGGSGTGGGTSATGGGGGGGAGKVNGVCGCNASEGPLVLFLLGALVLSSRRRPAMSPARR